MSKNDAYVHPDIDAVDALPCAALRDGFGEAIVAAAAADDRIVALCADVTDSVRLTAFKERFPDRYIEMGVAEQNMAAVAAGLAQSGKIPFMVTYAAFSPGRNWEQIRTTIALSDLPVKIIGMHTGVSVGPDGATHQMLEDITLMRVLPNMRIEVPADRREVGRAVHTAVHNNSPTYIRCTRHKTYAVTHDEASFAEGRAEYLWRSQHPQVAIIGAGPLLYDALRAAQKLDAEGVGTLVINVHSIKPMDIECVKDAVAQTGAVVTVEEHQILGGVGGTVAEILAQNTPAPQEMVAVHDRFGQSGDTATLLKEYGLSTDAIIDAVQRVIARKGS